MLWANVIRERRGQRRARLLSSAVVALPPDAKRAMLAALDGEELIVGAYTDRRGRACPMLATHRRGVRTQVGDFPRAWDTFAGAKRPRPATRRELEVLRALLEEGVAETDPAPAVADPPPPSSAPPLPMAR